MFDIIKAESPIVCNRAYHIYAQACSTKVSSKLKGNFNLAIKKLVLKKEIELEDELNDHQNENKTARILYSPRVVIRKRGDRTINEIPLSELATVIRIFSQKSKSKDAILRSVMAFYDLSRLTENAKLYLEKASKFNNTIEEKQTITTALTPPITTNNIDNTVVNKPINIGSNSENPIKNPTNELDRQNNEDIAVLLKRNGFSIVDNRKQSGGGHIWIFFDRNKHDLLKALVNNIYKISLASGGSRATNHKPAWWLDSI